MRASRRGNRCIVVCKTLVDSVVVLLHDTKRANDIYNSRRSNIT